MANPFQSVQMRRPSSNIFDLSHDVKYSMQMGNLTPVLVQEVIPGDVFKINTETLIRFAPLVSPVMHNVSVFTHYFFVPNRILWSNWEDFISPDLSKETPPASPYLSSARGALRTFKGTLWDYMGLPTGGVGALGDFPNVSALPFAAYQKIYNEYYRDQNLISEVDIKLANGGQTSTMRDNLTTIRRRAWMHDYFTSALPFAQKGPAVNIPLQDDSATPVFANLGTAGATDVYWMGDNSQTVKALRQGIPPGQGIDDGGLYVTPNATAASINDLRVAMRLQEWFEKAARGGSRYVEQLMVHWGVKSSDARLNRPEFLGGTKNPVIISEVLQTSSSDETSPQGDMAGHGISASSGKRIRYRAEEHGYIIGIQSVMPNTAYQQGLPRHFSRTSWEDYAWPTFAHLGEQEILNKELYVDPTDSKDEETFGYIPRYSEYRYTPSRVAGDFRDNMAFWHLGRIFSNRPNLNQQFIECTPRTDIFAVRDLATQNLWCHSYNKITVNRKLPKYGTPTL